MSAIVKATAVIEQLAPGAAPVPIRTPLLEDECRWFLQAIDEQVVQFVECPPVCFRLKKWGAPGPDHFVTPDGKPRHLFSKPGAPTAWLNREYVPHIAAYAYAKLEAGYDDVPSSFSRYRTFSRDVLVRKQGSGYETDAEFYGHDGSIVLQIEAKASPTQTAGLASAIADHRSLTDLPTTMAKEIEYVVDLEPACLWIVGPGSVDPPQHVFRVAPTGGIDVGFTPVAQLPDPPTA